FPQRRFPSVTVVRDRIMVRAAFAWHGTAALYSLLGERLTTTSFRVGNGATTCISTHSAAGVRIIRLRSDKGDAAVVPVGGIGQSRIPLSVNR
ncbi:MAG: hypothetical protein JXA18_12825, partial [Chitinispirillaceae bacterium]|nr:hypothetical protein [Chitinispirillaceae bacterium]